MFLSIYLHTYLRVYVHTNTYLSFMFWKLLFALRCYSSSPAGTAKDVCRDLAKNSPSIVNLGCQDCLLFSFSLTFSLPLFLPPLPSIFSVVIHAFGLTDRNL